MITLLLMMMMMSGLPPMWPSSSAPPSPPPSHLRFSSAYAWNVSSLPAASFNLAQASLGAVAPLATRGLPSALTGLQGTVFVRTSTTDRRLAADWEAQLDRLAVKMRPLVRPGFIEAVFLGDEVLLLHAAAAAHHVLCCVVLSNTSGVVGLLPLPQLPQRHARPGGSTAALPFPGPEGAANLGE